MIGKLISHITMQHWVFPVLHLVFMGAIANTCVLSLTLILIVSITHPLISKRMVGPSTVFRRRVYSEKRHWYRSVKSHVQLQLQHRLNGRWHGNAAQACL